MMTRLGALALALTMTNPAAWAQTAPAPAQAPVLQGGQPVPPAAGKAIKVGEVLTGKLAAMRSRGGKRGKRTATYQVISEPRRLPEPGGLCNLETGPETFLLVTQSDAQTAQLKKLAGKEVHIKIGEVACASEAGVISEAVVSKWSLVSGN